MANTDTQTQAIWTAVENSNADQLSRLLGNTKTVEAFNREDDDRDYLLLIVQAVSNNDDRLDILEILYKAFPTVTEAEAGRICQAFFSRYYVTVGSATVFKLQKFLWLASQYISRAKIDNTLLAQNIVRLVIEKGDNALLEKCLQNQHLIRAITKEFKKWFFEIIKLQISNEPHSLAVVGKMHLVNSIIDSAKDTNSIADNADANIIVGSHENTGSSSNSSDSSTISESNETTLVNCSAALSTIGETHVLAPLMKSALAVTSLNATNLNATTIENYYKTTYRSALSEIKNLPKPVSSIDNFREAVSALVFTVVKTKDLTNEVPENICIQTAKRKGALVKFELDECKLDFASLPIDKFDCTESHKLGDEGAASLLYGAAVGVSAALSGAIYCSEVTHASEHLCEYLLK